jgi:hypothetical protein
MSPTATSESGGHRPSLTSWSVRLTGLRHRFLPEDVNGVDVLDRPLDETSGLLANDG